MGRTKPWLSAPPVRLTTADIPASPRPSAAPDGACSPHAGGRHGKAQGPRKRLMGWGIRNPGPGPEPPRGDLTPPASRSRRSAKCNRSRMQVLIQRGLDGCCQGSARATASGHGAANGTARRPRAPEIRHPTGPVVPQVSTADTAAGDAGPAPAATPGLTAPLAGARPGGGRADPSD